MAAAIGDVDDEEQVPLNSTPLDERILDVVRKAKKNDNGHRTVRPALLASELGLSVEEGTRELCGLLAAVGGGLEGASFVFEKVEMPDSEASAAVATSTTTMVFTFPPDFAERAIKHRREEEWRQRIRTLSIGVVKATKIIMAFGLIISLAILIIAGICLLVAAVIALARGGGGGGHRNHPLMHRLRYLFFQLRQILWIYAICGSAIDGQQDPFMREIAGDLAFAMSICCGNPMHPFFWFRIGGMRRRWARVRQSRGWGGSYDDGNMDGIAMMRRGSWGDDNEDSLHHRRSSSPTSFNSSSDQQQRGLLSIAVEFLFGDSPGPGGSKLLSSSSREREKWKFRATVIMTLSSASPGEGIPLRDLLPFVDNPPMSAEEPSALREALRIVTYFNGKPADCKSETARDSKGMAARFYFPELVAEMDCQKLVTLGSSVFAPPTGDNMSTILYVEDGGRNFGASGNASTDIPDYLYEQPLFLTELSREQFGQCTLLGLLNLVGVFWIKNAMLPGALLELPTTGFASMLIFKLFSILQFYACMFFLLPLGRLVIVLIRNHLADKRNKRRLSFVRTES